MRWPRRTREAVEADDRDDFRDFQGYRRSGVLVPELAECPQCGPGALAWKEGDVCKTCGALNAVGEALAGGALGFPTEPVYVGGRMVMRHTYPAGRLLDAVLDEAGFWEDRADSHLKWARENYSTAEALSGDSANMHVCRLRMDAWAEDVANAAACTRAAERIRHATRTVRTRPAPDPLPIREPWEGDAA